MAVELRLLRPGEWLPPPGQMAQAMDVSEITVRRALTALAQDGVLERRRGRNGGTLVAEQPRLGSVAETDAYRGATAEVHDLIDHRLLLECGVAHLAALSATKSNFTVLQRLVRTMDRAATWAEFHNADERFHLAVASATRLPSASRHYGVVLRELYHYYLPYPVEYLRESNCEHAELVDAIVGRDPVAAVAVARRHVETLHETMFVGLRNT
jgi:DNA-binding FadR family transcriptional regulator